MHEFGLNYLGSDLNFSGDRTRSKRVIRLEDVGDKISYIGENMFSFSEPFIFPETIREGDILYSLRSLLEGEVTYVNGRPERNDTVKGIPVREDCFYQIEEICKVDLFYKKIYARTSKLYCGITPELFDKRSIEIYF